MIISANQAAILDSRAYGESARERSTECDECGETVWLGLDATAIVREWHNDTHPGVFDYCDQQPCHAITRAAS